MSHYEDFLRMKAEAERKLGTPVVAAASPSTWCRIAPFGPRRWLAPGVLGAVHHFGEAVVITQLEAVTEGSGDVGRFLDRLPRDVLVCAAEVLSDRLAGMLERRGFHRSGGGDHPDDWFRFPPGPLPDAVDRQRIHHTVRDEPNR